MTPAQKVMLMIDLPAKGGRRASVSLFTQAATVQGWKKSDRDLRLKVFSLAVTFAEFGSVLEFREALENYDAIRAHPPSGVRFRHLASASDLNHREDVDRVKILLLMLADNLNAAEEHGKPERGHARRWRDVLADHMKCLAIYPGAAPMGIAGAQAFVQTIIDHKFNHGRVDKMTLDNVDESPRFVHNERTGQLDEKPSQMEQLLWTVNARLNGKTGYRAKAGHSMHEMLTNAGLPCWCKACLSSARREPDAAAPMADPVVVNKNPF
ncbi:MAG TPA: hypothetical protein VNN22_18380 [Verrucomicrobiae bacterium]|nr:hypothetical protein [Verrucomicrobiae bacterium]